MDSIHNVMRLCHVLKCLHPASLVFSASLDIKIQSAVCVSSMLALPGSLSRLVAGSWSSLAILFTMDPEYKSEQ